MQSASYVNWVSSLSFDEAFIILVAPICLIAALGTIVVRLIFGRMIGASSTVGQTKAGIAAEIYAVVLGFVVLFGFDHFNETRRAVLLEASLVDRLRTEIQFYPDQSEALHSAVENYILTVLNEEWPSQVDGRSGSLLYGGLSDLEGNIRRAFSESPNTDMTRLLDFVDQINEQRATRLSATPDTVVSSAIFQMLIVGLFLSLITGWFVRGPSLLVHVGLSSVVAGSIVLLMVLSAQLTYPFTGPVSISNEPFKALLTHLE